MILRCWMFFYSFSFSPCFKFLALICDFSRFSSFSLCSVMSESRFASDATYAEKFTKVPTYCPLVAVECSFDDDEVISSYYTLWHRREWPVRERKRKPFSFSLSLLPANVTLARGFFPFSDLIANLASRSSFVRWFALFALTCMLNAIHSTSFPSFHLFIGCMIIFI